MSRIRSFLIVVFAALFGLMVFVLPPQAEEPEEAASATTVSDADLEMYIAVYTAMQDDHDLTIDNAITKHTISLDDFRQIERRIQNESRLVEKVRDALLEHAKKRALFAKAPDATPTPERTEPESAPAPRKRR